MAGKPIGVASQIFDAIQVPRRVIRGSELDDDDEILVFPFVDLSIDDD